MYTVDILLIGCLHAYWGREGKPKGLPTLPVHMSPTIALLGHKDKWVILLQAIHTSVPLSPLSQCSTLTHRCNVSHWYSARGLGVQLGQGAQGPLCRASRAHRSLTALHPSYMSIFSRNTISKYSDDYVRYKLYTPSLGPSIEFGCQSSS